MSFEAAGDHSPPRPRWLQSPVLLVLLTRAAQLAAAPVTLWLVATRRPLDEQGLYFILWNVQGLAQLMELGVGNLIVHFASHETRHLALTPTGDLRGDNGARLRLLSLLREGTRWYGRFALGFVAIVGAGGVLLFRPSAETASVAFIAPWAIVTGCVALYLPLIPRLCTVEGSGGLVAVQRMRLAQVLAASGLQWGVLWVWGAPWAVAAFGATWLLVAWWWLRKRHAPLIRALRDVEPGTGGPKAMSDVRIAGLGAMHRRTAATWLAVWAGPQLLTPIVLLTHGAAAAGRAGMTLAIAMAPSVLAGAWLQARYPRYAALLARGERAALAALARRASMQAIVVGVACIAAAALAVWALASVAPTLGGRLLSPGAVILLGLTSLLWLLTQSLASYLRAWRTEPLTETVVGAVVFVAAASWLAAERLSLAKTVVAHAAIVPVVLVVVVAWWYSQGRWRDVPHQEMR